MSKNHKLILILSSLQVIGLSCQALAADITLNATVKWEDENGTSHDANNVQVQFWDEDIFFDDLLGTQQTNNTGNASITVNDATIDPFMRVFASSNAAYISTDGTEENTYQIKTATTDDIPGLIHNISVTAGNDSDQQKAFSIHQAIQFHHDYATIQLGAKTPNDGVAVTFTETGGTGSFVTGTGKMTIGNNDWDDWDVIHHEYGHILALNNNLDNNPGGSHSFGSDNIEKKGKDEGTRLAWGEGIATYLGLSAQDAGNLKTVFPNLPAHYIDESYHFDDPAVDVSIENRNVGVKNFGEGDETSVMRILWDLYDTDIEEYFFDNEYSDKWELGDKNIFNLMKENERLSDFWSDMVDNHAGVFKRRSELGEVFEEYGVSSVLKNPMDDQILPISKIKFQFDEQNSTLSDLFKVLVFDNEFNNIIDQSGVLENQFEWDSNVIFQPGDYNWVVLNNPVMLDDIDLDKSYWSGSYQFSIQSVPEPISNQSVPEPITGLVFAAGLGGAALKRAKDKSKKS